MDILWSLFIVVMALGVYLLPTIVAADRKVPNFGSVAVINILLGWTLIGWVVAMAMAARSVPKTVVTRGVAAPKTFACPHCLEPVKVGASVCPHCQRDIVAAY